MQYSKTRNKWSVMAVVPCDPQRIYFVGEVTNFEGKRFMAVWKDDMDSDKLDIIASVRMSDSDLTNSEGLANLATLFGKLHMTIREQAAKAAANEVPPVRTPSTDDSQRVLG